MTAGIDAIALSKTIRPMPAGHDPTMQGAAFAELISMFIAGHHPEMLAAFINAVRGLVPISEKAV